MAKNTRKSEWTAAEWIELSIIGIATTASWLTRPYLPSAVPLWQIVLCLAGLLLAQSLVRDVAILLRQRRVKAQGPSKEVQCFCLESTIGTTGVVAAAALVWLPVSATIAFSAWQFSLAIAGTLVLGFLIKDLVISWNPLGLRREKNHLNLIVRWKSKSN